jgi:hypothetical protein
MSNTLPLSAALALTSLAVGCATPITDSLLLSQSAIDSASRMAPTSSEKSTSSSESQITMTIPGNLGHKGSSSVHQQSSMLANGLKETITRGKTTMGPYASESVFRTISLCGLIPIVLDGGSPGSMGNLLFTGKSGTPVAIGASPNASVRQATLSLEASSPDVCKPEIGATFSFKTTIKIETNVPPFRRVVDVAEASTCRASADFKGHDTLREAGGSLLLTCSIAGGPSDRPIEQHFVFFPRLMEYFPVFVKFNERYYYEYNYTRPPT